MSEPSTALQVALYSALDTALSCSVYDHVPQDSAFPYVTIDYEESFDYDYLTGRKDNRYIYISVWSQYRGQKEVKEIMATIDGALHNKRFTLTTGSVAKMRVLSKRTNRDMDGITYMGQVRVNVITNH